MTDSDDVLLLEAKARPIDGLTVARALPSMKRRMIGPFLFFDHIGPTRLAAGQAMDVRPHPHIHLATVTYLFEGRILHRDSLGSRKVIEPGAINWMTAGRGIVHSERTPPELRGREMALHGLQLWVALPTEHEDEPPSFQHHPAATIPDVAREGVALRVLAGAAYGATSPVVTRSKLHYVEAKLEAGATLELPDDDERGVYVLDGAVTHDGGAIERGHLGVFLRPGPRAVRATQATHAVLLGGASVGPRFIEWNFASSSKERIEQAKDDWRARRFPLVPGDEEEWIPLP